MQQITVTVDLTVKNLEILKQLCEGAPVEFKIEPPIKKEPFVEEHPVVASLFPEKTEAEPVKTYSKTDVKAVCLQFSKAGRQEELKAAFAKFGAKKLTEVPEDKYADLMEVLGNA